MRTEIKLAGYGGQGVITLAVLLAECGMEAGLSVTQTQAYVAVARGGSVWAEVVLNDGEIHYPRAMMPDYLVLLSESAAKSYKKEIKKDSGVYIVDPTTVRKIKSKTNAVYEIPAAQIAAEEYKQPMMANMILFGAMIALLHQFPKELGAATVKKNSTPAQYARNLEGFERGFNMAAEMKLSTGEAPQ